jgi:hypothetical protein
MNKQFKIEQRGDGKFYILEKTFSWPGSNSYDYQTPMDDMLDPSILLVGDSLPEAEDLIEELRRKNRKTVSKACNTRRSF